MSKKLFLSGLVASLLLTASPVLAVEGTVALQTKASFKDVSADTNFDASINFIQSKGIVSGFGDNTFRPENTVTRAELLKMILLAKGQEPAASEAAECFPDVDKQMWYAKYICHAENNDIVNGFPDGTFKPNQPVSYKEALKISMNTLDQRPAVETQIWYKAYEDKAYTDHIAVPNAEDDSKFARSEMAELLTRTITKKNGERTSVALRAPTIVTPTKSQILTNYPREAKISWTTVSLAEVYELEITCDYCVSINPMWQGPTYYKTTENSFLTPPLAGDNEFRVRVRAKTYQGEEGPWSDFRYFRYDTSSHVGESVSNVALTAPTITSPDMNATLTQYPRTTEVQWTEVAGAYKYEVELACDICSSIETMWLNPISLTTASTALTTEPLWGDNQFRIRARAIGSVGQQGPWSEYVYFSYDTSSYMK